MEMDSAHSSNMAVRSKTPDMSQHLEAMLSMLEAGHCLKIAARIESIHPGRVRYIGIISIQDNGFLGNEETCILGFDCQPSENQGLSGVSLGLIFCIYADSKIELDGDGGFSVTSGDEQRIFKPVSVHTLWSVLQCLHKASGRARSSNHFIGGTSHKWAAVYTERINSDRSCLNEWNAMSDIESRRPASPDVVEKTSDRAEMEKVIRARLRDLMMTVDLDNVTTLELRTRLEKQLQTDLKCFKTFIDTEVLTILGQMDGASCIFDHVFLGSEWNASNLEELKRNGVKHILNVTREIDNFFPGTFDYMNVRVYDEEATELLKYWEKTFAYIRKARESGSKVLVHCRMGVSRSASVVIAYAMKAKGWNLQRALEFVKNKRACVRPNPAFMHQLEVYEGILIASRHRHNQLFRSKSETNINRRLTVRGENKAGFSTNASCQSFMAKNLRRGMSERTVSSCVRLPGPNGEAYSVSQNKAVQLENDSQLRSLQGCATFTIGSSPILRPKFNDKTEDCPKAFILESSGELVDSLKAIERTANLVDTVELPLRVDSPPICRRLEPWLFGDEDKDIKDSIVMWGDVNDAVECVNPVLVPVNDEGTKPADSVFTAVERCCLRRSATIPPPVPKRSVSLRLPSRSYRVRKHMCRSEAPTPESVPQDFESSFRLSDKDKRCSRSKSASDLSENSQQPPFWVSGVKSVKIQLKSPSVDSEKVSCITDELSTMVEQPAVDVISEVKKFESLVHKNCDIKRVKSLKETGAPKVVVTSSPRRSLSETGNVLSSSARESRSAESSPRLDRPGQPGVVQKIKQDFEAKTQQVRPTSLNLLPTVEPKKAKGLISSIFNFKRDESRLRKRTVSLETVCGDGQKSPERSVKDLVSHFEPRDKTKVDRPRSVTITNEMGYNTSSKFSINTLNSSNKKKKKQHGKTHPLQRLCNGDFLSTVSNFSSKY
ncbi:hypothetical protein QYM36_012125 [Artemia franciscana]|uniref:protein-serine/threonine phosphatase n=1 Tax=Artemia franciscana TaxID=6661 RepID=A0AA88L2Z4_ARTSF|nr:hypothetical protein QYM36_012125 [Artemia franciscana]